MNGTRGQRSRLQRLAPGGLLPVAFLRASQLLGEGPAMGRGAQRLNSSLCAAASKGPGSLTGTERQAASP